MFAYNRKEGGLELNSTTRIATPLAVRIWSPPLTAALIAADQRPWDNAQEESTCLDL